MRLIQPETFDNRSYKQARYSTGLDFIIPVTQEEKDYLNEEEPVMEEPELDIEESMEHSTDRLDDSREN